MTINQVKCDKCGKVEDKISSDGWGEKIFIPTGWSIWYAKDRIDLCPTCVEKVEEFIQGLKV